MPDEAPIRFEWDPRTRRFRDLDSGRYLSHATIVDLRDTFAEAHDTRLRALAHRLATREISVQQWEAAMRDELKAIHVAQYMLGRGGRNAMTAEDWGRVGHVLRDQYAYLRAFAEEIARGQLTEARAGARSEHYARSGTQSMERGRAAAYSGTLHLPAYPGDGSTACKGKCRCYWRISEQADVWVCRWTRTARESCDTCVSRASAWSALIIGKVADDVAAA